MLTIINALKDVREQIFKLRNIHSSELNEITKSLLADVDFIDGALGTSSVVNGIDTAGFTRPLKRKKFPKRFYITDNPTPVGECLYEEVLDSDDKPLYCCKRYYEAIIDAAVEMTLERIGFDRYSLQKRAAEIETGVTTYSVMLCTHFWMSSEENLLEREVKGNSTTKVRDCETFESVAMNEWRNLKKSGEMIVQGPKVVRV